MTFSHEIYISEIRNQILQPEEETRLISVFQKREKGWEEAQDQVIKSNLMFVVKVAFEFSTDPHRLSDLISEGNMALLDCLHKFDQNRGFKLISFAAKEIRGRMIKFIAKNGDFSSFHISSRDRENLRKVRDYVAEYSQLNSSKPSSEEIQKQFGFNKFYADLYIEMLESQFTSINSTSFSSGEDKEKLNELQDNNAPDPFLETNKIDMINIMRSIINTLSKREREILNRRFGLDGAGESDLASIGLEFNLTKERIRQIEDSALKKIKKEFRKFEA